MKTILLISPYWKEEHRWMVSTVKLSELWRRLGYRVVVACMGERTGVEDAGENLRIYRKRDLFLPDPWNYGVAPGFTGMVRRIIAAEKPDHLAVNKVLFWTSLSVITLRLTGRRVLLLTDALVGITWRPRAALPRMIMSAGAWTVGWLVLLAAHRIVFFHPQPEGVLRRLGIAGKSQVIPTGIDPLPFKIQDSRFKNQTQDVTITYVGRLESVKGVDDFLAAVVPLKERFPQITVQVVGWYRDGHELVARYEREVLFTGLRHDIPRVLAATDIFVLPSHSEGLSNALMEAMASACACVASDVGGNRFLIQNGVSGFLFTASDRAELAAHVRRLIEDPAKRKSMGEAARRRIDAMFSWEVVGSLYEQLFKEMPISTPAVPDRCC